MALGATKHLTHDRRLGQPVGKPGRSGLGRERTVDRNLPVQPRVRGKRRPAFADRDAPAGRAVPISCAEPRELSRPPGAFGRLTARPIRDRPDRRVARQTRAARPRASTRSSASVTSGGGAWAPSSSSRRIGPRQASARHRDRGPRRTLRRRSSTSRELVTVSFEEDEREQAIRRSPARGNLGRRRHEPRPSSPGTRKRTPSGPGRSTPGRASSTGCSSSTASLREPRQGTLTIPRGFGAIEFAYYADGDARRGISMPECRLMAENGRQPLHDAPVRPDTTTAPSSTCSPLRRSPTRLQPGRRLLLRAGAAGDCDQARTPAMESMEQLSAGWYSTWWRATKTTTSRTSRSSWTAEANGALPRVRRELCVQAVRRMDRPDTR